jgi:site-specific recombinase XerD
VRAYRDARERAGRSPTTEAKHLSALRGLAEALGVETQQLRTVRSERVGRGEPRTLTHDEWSRLPRMPDRRTRQGKRDLALLHLLGSAGLRRAEASRPLISDIDERRRASDARLRQAIKGSSSWW